MSDGTAEAVIKTSTSNFLLNRNYLCTPPACGKSKTTVGLVFKYPNVLQWTFTWHDDLVAGYTFGGELITVAVVAEQGLVLAGEGLICQRAITAEAAETVLVIMPVLVEEFLAAAQKTAKCDHLKKHIIEMDPKNVFGCNNSQSLSLV